MDDERRIDVTLTVKDAGGSVLVPQPIEQLQAALALLAKALSVPVNTFADGQDARAEELVYTGLKLLMYGLPHLDRKHATELVRFGIEQVKQWLPVRVEWDIFNDDGERIGACPQWISQREAEERFGL